MVFGQGKLWTERFQKRWNLEGDGLWSGEIMEIMVSEKVQFREGWSLVRGNYGDNEKVAIRWGLSS